MLLGQNVAHVSTVGQEQTKATIPALFIKAHQANRAQVKLHVKCYTANSKLLQQVKPLLKAKIVIFQSLCVAKFNMMQHLRGRPSKMNQ